jgi:hypothetical protein
MYKAVSYKNKPAVVISANDTAATIMYMVEENNMVQAKMETIYDKTLLSDYSCPHADETDPVRKYCVDGKCTYCMESPGKLSFMCSICNVESMMFEDAELANKE